MRKQIVVNGYTIFEGNVPGTVRLINPLGDPHGVMDREFCLKILEFLDVLAEEADAPEEPKTALAEEVERVAFHERVFLAAVTGISGVEEVDSETVVEWAIEIADQAVNCYSCYKKTPDIAPESSTAPEPD